MPLIYGIDPGTRESAIAAFNGRTVTAHQLANDALLSQIRNSDHRKHRFAIEMLQCMGMIIGASILETALFIGALREAITTRGGAVELIYRREVKLHICGQARAKDANIRQALIDRFGEKGTKANPGVTHGLKSHLWQAFAVAVTAFDKLK